jgi:release factor glutamine methyltransferase
MKRTPSMRQLIHEAGERLAEKGVESPELNARLLLAHVLGVMEWKLSVYRSPVTSDQVSRFQALVDRRAQRIPLQHLVGSVGFYGLDLMVSPDALIPRPETEILVETVLEEIKKARELDRPLRILDMATGTGCIALALANEMPSAEVWGVDVSESALKLAQENARHCGLDQRVKFVHSDLWSAFEMDSIKWDVIVSNPPYIPTEEIPTLEPEVRDHDPLLALDGGDDGLDFYYKIASESGAWLHSGGFICLECGKDQASSIEILFKSASWFADRVVRDYNKIRRILVFRREEHSRP